VNVSKETSGAAGALLRRVFWATLGVCIVVSLAMAGCHYLGARAQAEGERYVKNSVVPALWDPERVIRLASSNLLAEVSPEQMSKAIQKIAAGLGHLRTVRGIRSNAYSVNLSISGLRFSPSYDVQADFMHGSGSVSIILIKEHGEWRIRRLRVSAPTLTF